MSERATVRTPDVNLLDLESFVDDAGRETIKLHEHGYITLRDHMGEDLTPVNAAKVSFAQQQEEYDDHARGLSAFLMREKHGSPYEHAVLQFEVRAPLFVFYEWHRSRTQSYNEESGRYVELRPDFRLYHPHQWTQQIGRPGAYKFEPLIEVLDEDDLWKLGEASTAMELAYRFAYRTYKQLLDFGISKQQARAVLPVGIYKEMWVTLNLRALMKFLELRMDSNAQEDIQEYAHAMFLLAGSVFPNIMEQFAERGYVCP